MKNLYFIYIMKRCYLVPDNEIEKSDLEDIRVYVPIDYAIAELVNENFFVLSGDLMLKKIVRKEYYYDEDYMAILDKKINIGDIDVDKAENLFLNLKKIRKQKLYRIQGRYYMTMYNVFAEVEDMEAIDDIRNALKRNIKKQNRKIINYGEIARK